MHSFFIVALRTELRSLRSLRLGSVILCYQALSRKTIATALRPLFAFRFRFDNSVKLRLASFRNRRLLHSVSLFRSLWSLGSQIGGHPSPFFPSPPNPPPLFSSSIALFFRPSRSVEKITGGNR